ncbi:MAG: glycosyltransferase 87 family protein [Terracoccus sp.]
MGTDTATRRAPAAAVLARPQGWVWVLWGALVLVAARRLVVELSQRLLDLAVYVQAGADVVNGASPYVVREALPFTYPPFAALLATPLSLVSAGVAGALVSVASGTALVVTVLVLSDRLGLPRSSLWWTMPGLVVMSPIWRTFGFGQVNLVLMALVVVDAFVVPRRWRGLLTGLAAGIKVVPGIFAVYYLATRQWRACALSAIGFLATVGLGWVVLPNDSPTFWFVLLRDSSRVGALDYPDNVSLTGSLLRTFGDGASGATWPLAVIVVAAGAVTARVLHRRGDDVAALTVVAMAGLLASPITWSHHWVWVVPIGLWLLSRRLTLAAVLLLAATCLTPLDVAEWLPNPAALTIVGWFYPVLAVVTTVLLLNRSGAQRPTEGSSDAGEARRVVSTTAPTTASQG